jgi:predicted transcriptional regulator of viral defense system/very-short-patch-repair endonuclease
MLGGMANHPALLPAIPAQLRGGAADRAIAALAARQHDVVSREQLLRVGLSRHAIEHRITSRRLRRIYRGVYTVRQGPVGREGWWMGAVLLGGPGAVLSHRPAAAHLGLRRSAPERTEVTVPHERRQCKAVRFRCARIEPDEITVVDRIPVTTVPRTLFDLAGVLPRAQVEAAINEAEALRLSDALSLATIAERYPRRRGAVMVQAILTAARIGATRTRSELEIAFLELLDRFRLPRPETNAWLQVGDGWIEVDCLWREQRLVAELDSRRFHLTGEAFEADRARDRALAVAGWRPIRVTWRHLGDAVALAADLSALLATDSAARAPARRGAGPRRRTASASS